MTIYDVKCSSQILIQIRHKFFMLFAWNSQSDFKTYRVQDRARIGRGYETDCLTSRQSGKRSQDNTSVTRLKTQVWHASKMCIGQTVYMWERLFEYQTDCLTSRHCLQKYSRQKKYHTVWSIDSMQLKAHMGQTVWIWDRLSNFETDCLTLTQIVWLQDKVYRRSQGNKSITRLKTQVL